MKPSYQNKRALLLGNGVNQLDPEQSVSWGDLLDSLKLDFDIDVDLNNPFKPFPLAFEEMLHRQGGSDSFEEKIKTLKKAIRDKIDVQLNGKEGYNEYHTKLLEIGYDEILTTNYDYGIERSCTPDFFERKDELAVNKQERKFSLKRRYKLESNSAQIWHIHGELFDSRKLTLGSKYYNEDSIMIGYEHYASYLEKIQSNFNGKKGPQKPEYQSLLMRIKNDVTGHFWTDIFFTHNIDIVGLGLDFSENHLWWLINQRANYIRNHSDKNEVLVNNEICFYFPEIEERSQSSSKSALKDIIRKTNATSKARAIAEVLKAFQVIPKPIKCKSYSDFYITLTDTL